MLPNPSISTSCTRPLAALGLLVLTLLVTPAGVSARTLARLPPVEWLREGKATLAAGRHYATDRSTHVTRTAAIARSVRAPALSANLNGSARGFLQPFNLINVVAGPVLGELGRQRVSGGKLRLDALDGRGIAGGIAGGFLGGLAGSVGGAAIQSTLARLGPIGVAAGFLARPVWAMVASTLGVRVGRAAARGGSWRDAVAETLLNIRPMRDFGGAIGASLGAVVGQALIPIPFVGALVGGMVGGAIGSHVGSVLAGLPGFHRVEAAMRDGLAAAARWVTRGRRPAVSGPAPENDPSASPAASPPPSPAGASPPLAVAARPAPALGISLLSIGVR